jgi:hypothetical protein
LPVRAYGYAGDCKNAFGDMTSRYEGSFVINKESGSFNGDEIGSQRLRDLSNTYDRNRSSFQLLNRNARDILGYSMANRKQEHDSRTARTNESFHGGLLNIRVVWQCSRMPKLTAV